MPKTPMYYKPAALGERGPKERARIFMSYIPDRLKSKSRALGLTQLTAAQVIGISYSSLCKIWQGGKPGKKAMAKIQVFLTTRYSKKLMENGMIELKPKA